MAGEKYVFDPDTMTIGELEDFEEVAGQPLQAAFADPENFSAKALKAIVWILRRRKEPDLEPDAVRDVLANNVRMKEVLEKDSDPTNAANAG